MGFMSETKIIAGSSSYNLAGDQKSRGNFLKSTILSLVVSGSSENGMGKGIVDAHINGPAAKYRRFFKWAETSGFNDRVGNYTGTLFATSTLSQAGFDFIAPILPTQQKRLVSYTVGPYNPEFIATALIAEFRPERRGQSFEVEQEMHWVAVNFVLNEYVPTGRLIVRYADGGIDYFDSGLNSLNPGMFAYVIYEKRDLIPDQNTDTGTIEVETEEEIPPLVGGIGSKVPNIIPVAMQRKITTKVERPDEDDEITEETENVSTNFNAWTRTRERTVESTGNPNTIITTIIQDEEAHYEIDEAEPVEEVTTEEIPDPENPGEEITITTTVTTIEPVLLKFFKYRRRTKIEQQEPWHAPVYKVYQQGTSAYGDSVMFSTQVALRKFFPVLPLRRFNVSVKSDTFPDQYAWNRRASLKAFGTKQQYNKILNSMEDSDSINDIDHAWVVFGVALGAKTDDGLEYLYRFFKGVVDGTPITNKLRESEEVAEAWEEFALEVEDKWNINTPTVDSEGNYTYTTIKPPAIEDYIFNVSAREGMADWEYGVVISAKGGHITTGEGFHPLSKGKVGQCWVHHKSSLTIRVPEYTVEEGGDGDSRAYYVFHPSTTAVIAFGRQLSENVWEEYEMFDLVHTNHVHKGKNVVTLAEKALANPDENTGFIIPLHEGAFRESGLIERTQLSLECTHLVLNYYEKQKIPWYASGFFKIILIAVVIVVSVVTMGGGAAAAGGVLGTNVAVGAALGFAGTAAIVAGAVANALAAALISAVIAKASTALFGDKLGALIAAVVSMVVINLASNGGQFKLSDTIDGLTKADNLMRLSMSGISAVGDHFAGKAMELAQETMQLQADYVKQMEEIQQMTSELLGNGVDAQMLTAAIRYASEKPENFLQRTLMTGDDIVDATIKLVETFPKTQLQLSEI